MTDSTKKSQQDAQHTEPAVDRIFLTDDLVPDAAAAFRQHVQPVEKAAKTADVVLDTNVLLLPYGAGSNSLSGIVKVFSVLRQKKRLFLPAQVSREFIRNRPNKLAELQQQLLDKISRYAVIDKLSFPILDETPEYTKLNDAIAKTAALKKELNQASGGVVNAIRAWEWNDPVNNAYRDVFTPETIIQPKIDREKIVSELRHRYRLQVPPGYKDASKDDLGIGDYLIWKTILEIGAKNKKPLIFVSGEEKADWQHRSGGSGFLPRYELLDEYRRISGGNSFYIIPLSRLLEVMEAESSSVDEIKQEEERIQEANTVSVDCPYCDTPFNGDLLIILVRLQRPAAQTAKAIFTFTGPDRGSRYIGQTNGTSTV
ncbi:PIN domain-containing protein [Ralstonia solanacearum]|uniref:PIN domain-containing protein n=1 Tax=Ralstonia solanacearum TaxID=305 RepID=UPI001071F3C4|nr:PIN domain-containing protein [Ralstonia solanacearum]